MFLASQIAPAKLRNSATSWHLLLAARRHHRQVIGSDVNTDSNEHGDKPEPESPIMMRAPPVRSLAMVMMTLAVRMQMIRIVHGHARLQSDRESWVVPVTAGENHGHPFHGRDCPDLNDA